METKLRQYILAAKKFKLFSHQESQIFIPDFDEGQFDISDYLLIDTLEGIQLCQVFDVITNGCFSSSYTVQIIPTRDGIHTRIMHLVTIEQENILCLMTPHP